MLKEYLRHNIINTFFTITIGLGSWFFSFLILKIVSAKDLSIYNSFVALLIIAAFPGRWVNLMAVNMGATFGNKLFSAAKKYFPMLIVLSVVGLAFFAVVFFYSNFSIWLYFTMIVVILMSLLVSYYKGILQHERLFAALGWIGFAEIVIKILVFLGFISLGIHSAAMFFAIIIQYMISTVVLAYYTDTTKVKEHGSSLQKVSILTLFYGFGFLLMTNIDFVFSRIYLSDDLNKSYIGISQVAKFFLFGTAAIINVMMPTIQKYYKRQDVIKLSTFTGLAILAAGGVIMGIGVVFYAQLRDIFEFTHASKANLLAILFANIIFSLAQIPLTILLVKERQGLVWVTLFISLLLVVLYGFSARSISGFVFIFGGISTLLLISSTLMLSKKFDFKLFLNRER